MKKSRACLSILIAASLPSFVAAKCSENDPSCIRTQSDLGDQGNDYVAKTFDAYRQSHPDGACKAEGPGKRVLLTGYGLFTGVPYNISGSVVRSMADRDFWPDQIVLDGAKPFGRRSPTAGLISSSDHGAAAFNRSLVIDGERYEVCFLVVDVIWDLAGAILIHEESRFKPEMVLMTGRGGDQMSFEAGAINRASRFPGYDADGRSLGSINTPISRWLLPDHPLGEELPMTWDARALAAAAGPAAESLGYSAVGQRAARQDNDYLCNDISFVALHASQNKPTRFAGDKVVLDSPELSKAPVVGFLHFPTADAEHPDLASYGPGIFGWGKILAKTIELSTR